MSIHKRIHLFLFFLLVPAIRWMYAAPIPPKICVDSVIVSVSHVSCHGLRDGSFKILEVKGGQPPYHYSLDNVSFTTNPEFDRLWAGDYTLWVHDATGCWYQQTIRIQEPQLLSVSLTADKYTTRHGERVLLEAHIHPAGQEIRHIKWYPTTDFVHQNVFTQEIAPRGSQIFWVWVIDHQGCTAMDSIFILVEDAQIFIPNIFKPGSNLDSYFTVYAGEGVRQVRSMLIFNRWGRQVFSNYHFLPNDPLRGWNGKINNKLAPPEVYAYLIEIEFTDGRIAQKTGSITLIADSN